jgi:tRNA nucleotidyltransferase (CCA-adding enzyme)
MKVYLVGGAIRDEMLGLESKDNDYVVTGSSPEEMESYGFNQVGADFPVFLHPKTGDEWALARIERKVGVGYHGFTTKFDSDVTIEDDLMRRDLTINAMANQVIVEKDQDGHLAVIGRSELLIDPYGGMQDLRHRVLKHTSPAFREDPLRVLRLARFAARYGYEVDPSTMDMCKSVVKSAELDSVSPERYWKEIERAVKEPHAMQFFNVLFECGAIRETSFFKSWLGDMSYARIQRIMSHADMFKDSVSGTTILTAISATDFGRDPDGSLKMPGPVKARANSTWKLIGWFKDGHTTDALYAALREIGVWKNHNWEGFLDETALLEDITELPQHTSTLLLSGGSTLSSITAQAICPGEEGPHVGAALSLARTEACRELLDHIASHRTMR